MGQKVVYKVLKKYDLVDNRKIFTAGTLEDTNIVEGDYWGMRCISIKDDNLLIIRLGGNTGVKEVIHCLKKDGIIDIEYKHLLFRFETIFTIKTQEFSETYCLTINRKKSKQIKSLIL